MKTIGSRRYPCCDAPSKLSQEDQDFVDASTTAGLVTQLLRRCRPCGRSWHLVFDRADHASLISGLEVYKITWEAA